MARVIYSEETRSKVVEAVVKDKKKMLDVAQEHGVSLGSVRAWVSQRRGGQPSSSFLRVLREKGEPESQKEEAPKGIQATLRYGEGVSVDFLENASPSWVAKLLKELA